MRQARAVRAVSVGWTSPCSSRESLPWARTKVILMLTEGPGDTSPPPGLIPEHLDLGTPQVPRFGRGWGRQAPSVELCQNGAGAAQGLLGGQGRGVREGGGVWLFSALFCSLSSLGSLGARPPTPPNSQSGAVLGRGIFAGVLLLNPFSPLSPSSLRPSALPALLGDRSRCCSLSPALQSSFHLPGFQSGPLLGQDPAEAPRRAQTSPFGMRRRGAQDRTEHVPAAHQSSDRAGQPAGSGRDPGRRRHAGVPTRARASDPPPRRPPRPLA